MKSNKRKNSSGVIWSAVERFAIQGSQFIVSLVVARLLVPADYGLIAMMSIFIAIAISLIDSGMAQALVQRQNRSEEDLSTALIFNIIVAIGLYAIIYVSAPYIAQFYNAPELCRIARIYTITLIINSFSVVQQALITISLDFKRQAMASLTGIVIGGVVAIVMAYSGYGVWALVAQQLISAVIFNTLLWRLSPWRPRCGFSWSSFKILSNFGSKIMASGLMHVIYTNMYTLIIGKYFTQSDLGLYNRATTIAALPSSNISTIVERALYPILCEAQESAEVAATILLKYLRVVCFVVFPAMVGIAVMARPLTLTLLGEQWLDVVPLLQIIAIANMWDPIMKFYGSLIRSQGRSADFLRAETIKKCCGVVILIASIPFGVVAMCGGLLLYAIIDMLIVIFFARRISPLLGYLNLASAIAPTILTTALMGGVVWQIAQFTTSLPPLIELLIAALVGAIFTLGISIVIKRGELQEILDIIKR
ncbi:MAG: lipopolysaccharide biosynthesis protein [Rikenellaceae bacterium]